MRFISLFAGIGGLDLGLERAGMECGAQVEIDDFCQKVLTKNWPNVPKFKDVRDVGKHNLPTVDLICGGFPCQDVSLAGLRKGLNGKRSTLWSEFFRIACEIQPRWIVIENVSGLFSSDDGRFFTKILRELSEVGYFVEWEVIPAFFVGAIQSRERVFIIANSQGASTRAIMEQSGEWQSQIKSRGRDSDTARFVSRGWQDEPESRMVRVANGFSSGMDRRIKACGNAVVPQVAEFIGHSIILAEQAALFG